MKDWNIHDIENLTEDTARDMALETLTIKGHAVYLVDFEGPFGYSALVFCDGRHIYHANDYALHHRDKSRSELREIFLHKLAAELFTDSEFFEPLKTYDEYRRKQNFLMNCYGQRREHVSIFGNFNDKEYEAWYIQKTADMIFDWAALAHYEPEDAEFVKHHIELREALTAQREKTVDNYEYQKSAFLYEMYNHEYGINWQADWDVCSCFCDGDLIYHRGGGSELQDYFTQCKFNDTQRRAYLDARTQYYDEMRDRL